MSDAKELTPNIPEQVRGSKAPRDPETGKFLAGFSGNPAGRPKGAKGKFSGAALLESLQRVTDDKLRMSQLIAEAHQQNPLGFLAILQRAQEHADKIEANRSGNGGDGTTILNVNFVVPPEHEPFDPEADPE